MTIASLKTEVKKRISSPKLVQLTNEVAATTINEDVLSAACSDAIGEFRLRTGLEHDTDNYTMIPILVSGVVYYLEHYKSRDGNILSLHGKKFFGGCREIRERIYIAPISNSHFTHIVPTSPPLSDMDKNRNVFRYPQQNNAIQDVNCGSD